MKPPYSRVFSFYARSAVRSFRVSRTKFVHMLLGLLGDASIFVSCNLRYSAPPSRNLHDGTPGSRSRGNKLCNNVISVCFPLGAPVPIECQDPGRPEFFQGRHYEGISREASWVFPCVSSAEIRRRQIVYTIEIARFELLLEPK